MDVGSMGWIAAVYRKMGSTGFFPGRYILFSHAQTVAGDTAEIDPRNYVTMDLDMTEMLKA